MWLEDLGFEESRRQVPFTVRIKQFKDFKEKHGHLRITASLDKSLAIFCREIRRVRRNDPTKSRTVEERIQALDDI